jgi:hypothetical protein
MLRHHADDCAGVAARNNGGAPARQARAVIVALLRSLTLYSGLGWLYIAINSIVHPLTLSQPLTHITSWPAEGVFGAACFLTSSASFLALRIFVYARRRR